MIRQALPQDRPGVVATVAPAFAEDPGWAFIFGEEYERLVAHFVGALFDTRVAGKNVWVTDDLAGVAMWDPPGVGDDPGQGYAEGVWARYRAIAGEEACERLASYNDRFYERRGFEQAREIILSGGPPTWWLRRAPRRMGPT